MNSEHRSELLRLDGVRKSFGDHVVLREVDLTIEPGECVVLIGASGSGKSTLLRCVNLLEVVDDGVITFDGRDITDPRVDGDAIRAAQIETAIDFNYTPYVVAGVLFCCLTIPMARLTDRYARKKGYHGAGGHL